MALTPEAAWPDIPQWDDGTPLKGGGPEQPLNRQAMALGARTELLKSLVDDATSNFSELENPSGNVAFGGFVNSEALEHYSGDATQTKLTDFGVAGDWIKTNSGKPGNGGTVVTDADGNTWERVFEGLPNLSWFGVKFDGSDESDATIACLNATGILWVPKGKTLACKNIELSTGYFVLIDGCLSLPNGCSDFDRCIYAYDKHGLRIDVNEMDGNWSGQSGVIGTHLIYLVNCQAPVVKIKRLRDHYISSSATMPSIDGYRNSSSGAVFLCECVKADVTVDYLDGWSREGVYGLDCVDSDFVIGHCQGHPTRNTEYSGVQVSGVGNKLLRASVDWAGASGVGFDTRDGILSNVISTRSREQHGVNFGHPGRPASGSRASNIVVDGAMVDGIKVSASTEDLSIDNFAVKNAGRFGVSFSDGAIGGLLSNGSAKHSGFSNLQTNQTIVQAVNIDFSKKYNSSLKINVLSGAFSQGDTIECAGVNATVTHIVRNLSGAILYLFFESSAPASFAVGASVIGPSGSGKVSEARVPVDILEQGGGRYSLPVRRFAGAQNQTRFESGDMIVSGSFSCAVTTVNSPQTFTFTLPSNVVAIDNSIVTVNIGSVNSTGSFEVKSLRSTMTGNQVTIVINTTVAQTYLINFIAVGKWK